MLSCRDIPKLPYVPNMTNVNTSHVIGIKKSIGEQRNKIFILYHAICHSLYTWPKRSPYPRGAASQKAPDITWISEIRAAVCSGMRAGLNVLDRHGDAIDYHASIIAGDAFIGRFRDGHVDKINLKYEAHPLSLDPQVRTSSGKTQIVGSLGDIRR